MLSKYIKELIENNSRIIIPDFGAFMIQTSAQGKQISFNDFLKFNDGLLINQIIKNEKVSKNEATDKIKDFIKTIEKSFGEKKAYEIQEVGFLFRDDHGNIKFSDKKPEGQESSAPAATDVKPTIVLDESSKEKEEKPVAKEEPKKPEPEITKPTEETKKPEPKKEEPKPIDKKPEPKPADKKPEQKPVDKKPPVKPTTKTVSKQSSNTTQNIIIIAAAIIILGGGTWALIQFNVLGNLFGKKTETVVVEEPTPVMDTTPEVVETTPEPEPEPVVEEEPQEDPNIKKYYIVAGSFKVASNADNFNQKLINEGFDSEIIVRNNGYHIVSYKTLYHWNEAVAEWKNMRNTNAETWIFIK